MYGPYLAETSNGENIISYFGNKVCPPVEDVRASKFGSKLLATRLSDLVSNKAFYHLHEIDNSIFFATVDYFRKIKAEWCNLPLTTLMVSSPGEVYAGKVLDYTTDTLPVDLSWFDNEKRVFLSESSQFYLELRLLIEKVDKVFSIYNSFRKEKADFSHLSEFQHIEFEGKVGFEENIQTFIDLLSCITKRLVRTNENDLSYFLAPDEVESLETIFDIGNIEILSFKEALDILCKETGSSVYKEFSLKNFGSWEEIKLTRILGKHVIVTKFPLLQIPFYHNVTGESEEGVSLAENADMILHGYRETIGGGTRISNSKALAHKAEVFNLPLEDYAPYLQTREFDHYQETSGFGMGWQRYTHWLLKLPYIWEATHIPRGHCLPKP